MIGLTRADGETIRVEFEHYIHPCKLGKKKRNGYTLCRLLLAAKDQDPREGIEIAFFRAVCSSKDHYVKEKGRTESILGAVINGLHTGAITEEERAIILTAYFNRPRGTHPATPTPTKQTETTI